MAVAFVVVAGSLGLATVTATAQSGGSSCPSGADNYSDVVAGTTHADDIACLLELGIPAEGDTYRPGDDITRSEMARFMAGAYEAVTGSAADVADHAFTDVAGDPNEDDIARIAGLGITNGVNPEGTLYAPDDVVIRGHMALFLTRLYTAVAGSDAPAGTTEFTDIGERSAEQQAAIGQIFALGVTTGTTDTTYSPSNNVTREQMASFVARMYRVLDALPDPTEAPGAPTGVEVAVSGDDGDALDVSWTAPEESGTSDVTGYVVQWKSGDDDYSADNQSSVDGTSSTADGLTQGTAYTFRVAAVSDDGQSDWSDEASGNPGTAPGAVVDFTVDAGAVSGTLVLTWAAPADDGGTPITGYVVQWATGRDAASSAEISDGSATSYTITGLKTGVSYRVHIQAVNAAGAGAITAPADTDQSVVAPTTSVGSGSVSVVLPGPTDPEGSRLGGRFAAVTWLTPTLGRGQSFIETGAFHIQRKCGKEEWPATHTGDRASSQDPADPAVAVQSLDGEALLGGTSNPGTLTNGDECTYRVRANTYIERAGGTADTQDTNEPTLVGAWVQGSATPLGAPGTPGNATVEVANNSLRVTWTPPMVAPAPATGPEVNDGGSSITGYKITWASPATAPIGNTTVSATSTSHTITGLTNGLLYTVTIQAVNARGASTAAATDPANATPAAVAGAPTNVRVSQPPAPAQGQPDSRGNVLIVSWSAPAGNGTGNVTGYVVERRTSATAVPPAPPGDWGVLVAINSVGGPHTGTGTMATDAVAVADRGTSYDYRVRAENASGVGPWSTPGSGTAAALPSEVVNSRIEVIPGNRSLIVTWTPAAGNGNDVTHYNVRYARNVSGTEAWSSKRVNASALPTTVIGGLTSGAPYIIGITAVNAVGSSDEALTGGSDSPGFALAAPSSVTAMPASMDNTTGGNIVVTWSGVTNAVGYQVQWLAATGDSPGNPDGGWTAVTPSATALKAIAGDNYFDAGKARKVTIGDLTKGTTYVVRVRAVTQGQVGGQPAGPAQFGSPGFSAPVKAEGTPATAPADIDVAQPEKTTTLRVTWAPPADARVEGVTGYVVTWYPTLSTVTGNRGDANVGADARSYDITGLTAIGQGFTVVVSAVNEIGAGAPATDTATLTPATT
jgi:titin